MRAGRSKTQAVHYILLGCYKYKQIEAIEMEINDLNFSSIRWYEVTAPAVIKNREISTYRVDGSSVVLVVILLIVY